MEAGRVKVIITTPETIGETRWQKVWALIKERLVCLAIDEAHCLVTW